VKTSGPSRFIFGKHGEALAFRSLLFSRAVQRQDKLFHVLSHHAACLFERDCASQHAPQQWVCQWLETECQENSEQLRISLQNVSYEVVGNDR